VAQGRDAEAFLHNLYICILIMNLHRALLLALFVACRGIRVRYGMNRSQGGSSSKEPENPWNAFQKKYRGQGLAHKHFPILYRWEKRTDLEAEGRNAEDIVEQFRREFEDDLSANRKPVPMTAAEILSLSRLDKVTSGDLQSGFASVYGSPLAIARTLYSVILSHLPETPLLSQYTKNGTNPFDDFRTAFRAGSQVLQRKGIEERVKGWLEMLHDATAAYYDAKRWSKNTFAEKWLGQGRGARNEKKARAKNELLFWLDKVIHDLNVLAGLDGSENEIAEIWIPMSEDIYEDVSDDRFETNMLRDQAISPPIDTGIPINEPEPNGFINSVFSLLGFGPTNSAEQTVQRTKIISTLEEAYDEEYLLAELTALQGSLEDLRICFVEIAHSLKNVHSNFKTWKNNSLHNKGSSPLQQANEDWAKSSWDDLGITIPGDVPPQSKRLMELKDNGVITMSRFTGDPGDIDNLQPGFAYSGSSARLEHHIIINVNNFLNGGDIVQFLHVSEDIGDTAILYMMSPKIPRLVPSSARQFTFQKVNIGLYAEGLSKVSGLREDVIKGSGVWYKKEMKASYASMIRKSLQATLEEENGDPAPLDLRTGSGNIVGRITTTYGTSLAFAKMAL